MNHIVVQYCVMDIVQGTCKIYPIFSKTPTFQCFHIMTGYVITDKKFVYRMLPHITIFMVLPFLNGV